MRFRAGPALLGLTLLAACPGRNDSGGGTDAKLPVLRNTCEPLVSMPTGTIAFSRYGDDGVGIYLMNPDGSNVRCLVDTPGEDTYPAWAPDGSAIAFTSDLDGDEDLYVVNADGTGLIRLTNGEGNESGPAWSPDGTRVAFTSHEPEEGSFAVQLTDLEASRLDTVIESGSRFEYIQLMDWSPDGLSLLIGTFDGMHGGLLTLEPSRGEARLLAEGAPDFRSGATYSPDGSKLLFQSDANGGCLYVTNLDGTELERITIGCSGATATWSPDGRRIAFANGDHGPGDVYVMDADGTNRLLIDDAGDAAFLAWQPV